MQNSTFQGTSQSDREVRCTYGIHLVHFQQGHKKKNPTGDGGGVCVCRCVCMCVCLCVSVEVFHFLEGLQSASVSFSGISI